mmetsp:Transcript_3740/g.7992  ORF Transcript_3740/g.7992 Transcript_3740/m.7992 type:complete len:149 (+) Transcript_3740:890-1336(+)
MTARAAVKVWTYECRGKRIIIMEALLPCKKCGSLHTAAKFEQHYAQCVQSVSRALAECEDYTVPTSSRIFTLSFYQGEGLTPQGVELLNKARFDASRPHEFTECAVCCEDFVNREAITFLPCFHYLHQHCSVSWLTRKAECPICKFSF